MRAACVVVALGAAVAACVPADEAGALGSVQFWFAATEQTYRGVSSEETADGWAIRFDRVVLGFKTMTIGEVGVTDVCAYRGRGALYDVVFDPREVLIQSFNGIKPVACPDVGIIFGPPGTTTTLGPGATAADLVDLATGAPAHAIVEATATRTERLTVEGSSVFTSEKLRISLRLVSERTSSRFGGCHTAQQRGVTVLPMERDDVAVRFSAETLFRDAIAPNAALRGEAFHVADANADGVVTMDEIDVLPLRRLKGTYLLPSGSQAGSFGDFIRAQFRTAFKFRDNNGFCVGNEPGADEITEAAGSR